MSDRVYIYDTTLRDGAQTEGISFSAEDKMEILLNLDEFGIDFVEGGMPPSNPKDAEFFRSADKTNPKNAKLVSFGSTCKPDLMASEDPNIIMLSECPAKWTCIFGKAWDFHVKKALCTTLEENLRMIEDSISYLRTSGKHVIFDAEHFFDGYKANPKYSMEVLSAAVKGGAEWIVLCDTNGGSIPSFIGSTTRKVTDTIDVPVGIHCHNDSELAVACSLAAVENGARMVQGTINGLGERCGNANLCSVIPDLMLKMNYSIPSIDLSKLTLMSKFVSETANTGLLSSQPYVGDRAFAHKGGMHVSAMSKDTKTYEHVEPGTVGNKRKILISDMSGRASVTEKLREMNIAVDRDESRKIADHIKNMEAEGYQYEGADASFQLLVKRLTNNHERPFNITGFRLFIDDIGNNKLSSEASVKVIDRFGNEEHTASDGDGPVNALDNALRKALSKFYPVLNNIKLSDYKVRVLDEKAATAAPVRVLIRSTDGKDSWSTVGVSTNVIEASMIALSDSIEYAILKDEKNRGV
ncbi:MAG: citramalate synthase [Candidatus Methanomethylophilaceae archaeon]